MSKKIKKYVLPYFPYLIAFWFFSKCGTAYRMAAGANLGEKLFGMVKTIGPVFQSYAPGPELFDLAVGVAGAVILYFVVQSKIKKARKFRRDMEYGSARWGTEADIKELVYGNIQQGDDLVKGVQARMLAPVLKIHDGTRGTVYELCKVFLCPAFRLSLALDLPT